jgi:hypothetical protein
MQEIDSLASDFYDSLQSGLAQRIYWGDSMLSHFFSQHAERESILRQKIRSAELLVLARLGMDRGRSLRHHFQEVDVIVANFCSTTNSLELETLLYQVRAVKRFILQKFSMLESASQETHFRNATATSDVIENFEESNCLGSNADRHSSSLSISASSSRLNASPNNTTDFISCEAQSHFVRPGNSFTTIQVSLVRTTAGFGITLSQSGSDVVIAAVATGSPAHRCVFSVSHIFRVVVCVA